jgi:hypothetical protein
VLYNEYASVVQPIVEFIDEVREEHPDDQIVVLIPVIRPDKLRYRILHNQIDLILSNALRTRSDVVVARVEVPLEPEPATEGAEPAPATEGAPVHSAVDGASSPTPGTSP